MSNLYIWFPSVTERRNFVLKLLDVPELTERNGTKKRQEQLEDLTLHLDLLDAGKTKSPYYNLHKRYYFSRIPDWELANYKQPWDLPVVFMKGFRQLYTQNSYAFRPGKWLVLQFRGTKEAMKLYQWVVDQIPAERMGRNVPLPETYWPLQQVGWVKKALVANHPVKVATLQKAYAILRRVKKVSPELFRGKNVYLWEHLAFGFDHYGWFQQAETCLRIQAELQPKKSDAFLNLRVFLTNRGRYQEAMAAYRAGLERTPQCEYLNYNMAELATLLGRGDLAQAAINRAIEANPARGLNLYVKGELCLEKEQCEVAIEYFRHALDLSQEEKWKSLRVDCLRSTGFAYLRLNQLEQAKEALVEALSGDPNCIRTHQLLAQCYKQMGDEWLSHVHLGKIKEVINGR